MGTWTTIKRSELYQQVWQEPMSKLAQTYGLSDVGLAKICRKHNIPRPPRGYWAKKQHGQKPRQPALPTADLDVEIELRDPDDVAAHRVVLPAGLELLIAAEKQPEQRIRVAGSLHGAHALVRRANQELASVRADADGLIGNAEKRVLDVRVSKSRLRRALMLMDALLNALEGRGYAVADGPVVTIQDTAIRFGICEIIECVREPFDDHDLDGPYEFGHSRFKEKQIPSGRLKFQVHHANALGSAGGRRNWSDTEKKPLEEQLNLVVVGFVKTAARVRAQEERLRQIRETARAEEMKRQEAVRVLEEKRQRFRAEQARFDLLLSQAEDWHKSQLVRALIEAARVAHSQAGPIETGSKVDEWLQWAELQADRLDPLHVSPPSILDEDLGDDTEHLRGFRRTW